MRQAVERIFLTIWVGGMWAIGYIVAPVLFHLLSKVQAGTVAGQLFSIMSYVGLVSGVLLLGSLAMDAGLQLFMQWRGPVLVIMLLVICIGQFILQPQMVALRDAGLQGARFHAFMRLHGISQVLFLIASVGGLALVTFGLRKTQPT